jgi:FkbM family methyltransferase
VTGTDLNAATHVSTEADEISRLIEEFSGPNIREAREIAFLPHLLEGCEFFLDVGANIGQYAIAANQWLRNAHILAIEANPRFESTIVDLVSRSTTDHPRGNSFEVVIAAILDEARPVSFFVTPAATTSSVFAMRGSVKIAVTARRLDEFFRPARKTVVKMDIEGAEYRALLGAGKFLESDRCEFFLELHGWGDRSIKKYPIHVLNLFYARGYAARKVGTHYHFFRARRRARTLAYLREAPFLLAQWCVHRFAPGLVPWARRVRAVVH